MPHYLLCVAVIEGGDVVRSSERVPFLMLFFLRFIQQMPAILIGCVSHQLAGKVGASI